MKIEGEVNEWRVSSYCGLLHRLEKFKVVQQLLSLSHLTILHTSTTDVTSIITSNINSIITGIINGIITSIITSNITGIITGIIHS